MAEKEAKAIIKINKLLEESGGCFFDTGKDKAAIQPEACITMDDWGVNFEHAKTASATFYLLMKSQ